MTKIKDDKVAENIQQEPLFGEYLRSVRLQRGIDLAYLSETTKVTRRTLAYIEDSELDCLPPPVFIKGFIRTYCSEVGADAEYALSLYEKVVHGQPKRSFSRKMGGVRAGKTALLSVMVSCLVLLAIAALVLFGPWNKKPAAPRESAMQQKLDARTNGKNQVQTTSGKENEKHILVCVEAVDKTWLKAIVDGKNARKYSLTKGQKLNLSGGSSFNLLVADATAVRLTVDGKRVAVMGRPGQSANIRIP